MASARDQLRDLLAERSLVRDRVTLASGAQSDFYLDCRQTALSAEGAALIGELVLAEVSRLRAEGVPIAGVGGLTLGADPIAVATAVTSMRAGQPVHAFVIRKEPKAHGTQNYLEGARNLPQGAPVLIVEDVVTTGGSTCKAIERARLSGLVPKAVLALVDRGEGGRERIEGLGLPFAALFVRADFVSSSGV